MKKLLVVFPTIFEADCIFKIFGQSEKCKVGATCEFELGGKSCRVLVSGIGCEKSAERVAEQIKKFQPDEVFLCGFAGACRKEIKGGEFFFQSDSPETQKNTSPIEKPKHSAPKAATGQWKWKADSSPKPPENPPPKARISPTCAA